MDYSRLIKRKKEYKYSANLNFDLKNQNRLAEFIPNKTTTEILAEYLYGIIEKTNVHSRILYGSYGTGKSHLLTVLCAVLGQINTNSKAFEDLLRALDEYDKSLSIYLKEYADTQKPYFVVPVYSDHKDFDKCIIYSLKKELDNRNLAVCFKDYFQEALKLLNTWENGQESSSRLHDILNKLEIEVIDLEAGLAQYDNKSEKIFDEVFRLMTYGANFVSETGNLLDSLDTVNEVIASDYQGIVFVFDEFGRYLEDKGESVRVKSIQDLAEYCDHSVFNNYVILVSHKQLSLYTEKLRGDLSEEWKKVEGRFRATSINTKYDQCLSLIPHIIPKTGQWDKFSKRFEQELKNLFERAYGFKGFLRPQDGKNPFEGGFPLHPITLYALDRLSKRVAQNERTFFTYLASDEENALFKQIKQMDTNEFHFVGLDLIYDYFEVNIRAYRADDVYENYKKLQFALNKLGPVETAQTERKILKTMAVVNIIADTAVLSADRDTLKYVIDEEDDAIDRAIDCLEHMKIIKFMRQYGYYDFLDSSIYDFDSMIEEKMQGITNEMIMTELNEKFINFVVYPYEYNAKYHINRMFIPVFLQKQDISKKSLLKIIPQYYDGVLALVFDDDYSEEFYTNTQNTLERSIVLVNPTSNELREEVKRYIAIEYFYSIREELKKEDPTAVRELELYLEEQRGIVSEDIRKWKSFENSNILTFVNGGCKKLLSEKELATEASRMMFRAFNKTIIVNNDIVNKNNLSGTIKASRVKVISAIISGEDNGTSTFSPMSPEHTMLRSTLLKNGFIEDDEVIKNVFPQEAGAAAGEYAGDYVKQEIINYLRRCTRAQRPLQELVKLLKEEPFGLRDGYIPLLFAVELKKYENVGIYFHGAEREYSAEELLKAFERPDDYYFYLCDWTEEQRRYINGLEEYFEEYLTLNPKNRLRELLGAMNRHYANLPKIARATDKYVSEMAKQYRDIMSLSHKDFNKFFFVELPKMESNLDDLLQIIKRVCGELENVLLNQNNNIDTIVRNLLDFGKDETLAPGLIRIYESKWEVKKQKNFDYQTNAFLNYVQALNPESDNEEVVGNIAKIIAGFETDYWSDSMIEDFEKRLQDILERLDDYISDGQPGESEFQIIIKTAGEEPKVSTYDKCEISENGQVMLNKMKSTLNGFGRNIPQEEKVVILARLLSEI